MTLPQPQNYLALPPSGHGRAVLVLHAWWGLNGFIRNFCDRLAQEGFVALAPDMFSGKILQTIEEAERNINQLNWEVDIPPKILPAADYLLKHPAVSAHSLAVVGFSFGGYWALWLAQNQPEWVQSVTLFYGTNGGGGDFQNSKAAFLGHFAESDPNEPASVVELLEKRLHEADRPTTFYTYPGTGHWFFESDRPAAYNAPAAQLAWDRTLSFLRNPSYLSPGGGGDGARVSI